MSAYYAEGRYWVKVLDQSFGASKNKGTPEFALRFVVVGIVDPANPDGDLISCAKYERTMYMYITEGTAERLCEDLTRIGFDKDSFKFLNPENPNHHSFKDAEFEAYCKHEDYEGKAREKWSIAFPRGEKLMPAKSLDDKELRQLDNLFGKHLKNNKPARQTDSKLPGVDPSQQKKANAAMQEAASGDDVPF